MQLETKRLLLLPLDEVQIKNWMENIPALEQAFRCTYDGEKMEGVFLQIVREQAEKVQNDRENWLFHTFWLLLRKEDRVVVGAADFKAPPGEDGAVEIGYGLNAAYEHNGYMTEAVEAMCGWAFVQPGIRTILAETEPENDASRRVLSRCAFRQYREAETLWWKRIKT
ncbi:GNAT family N-acetyltransferase [Clostridium sp. D33t1_170424_F3]|uniref:GNAT family N-acetyltransferase n=1 Tax=Clostridium sp. D33t1_170424_F3 TaxID=2787099 RepID=UPI0018AA91C8|nr:GNAT family N-acetyltransferase [Clostridium sp. D33t1_170424_F3]